MGFHSPSIKGTHFGLRFFGRGFFFSRAFEKNQSTKITREKYLGSKKEMFDCLIVFLEAITTGILSCILFFG